MFSRVLLLVAVFACINGKDLTEEQKLFKKLMDGYDADRSKDVIPADSQNTVDVKFGIALLSLDIDEANEVLTAKTWIRMAWTDARLTWNHEEHGGVDHIRIPSKYLWIPDIVQYNAAEFQVKGGELNAVVSYDGTVLYIPPVTLQVPYNHFEGHSVTIFKFGSWSYDGFRMDINFYDNLEAFDVNDYIISDGIKLLAVPARKNTKYYPCCEEPYPDLTFTVEIEA